MGIVAEGEGDRFLEEVLDKNTSICDKIVLWGDDVDKKTKEVCTSFNNVDLFNCEKKLWNTKQWQIKEQLLIEKVKPLKPDWVLPFDMDEVFEEAFNRKTAEELTKRDEIAYEFYCVQLWDKRNKRRVDQGWGGFYNVRFYKFMPKLGLRWSRRTRYHCGLAPSYAYRWAARAEYAFKHYGYLKEEDRKKKVERYKKGDPEGIYLGKWWYESIKKKPVLKDYEEQEFHKKLEYKPKEPNIKRLLRLKGMNKNKKLIRVKNTRTGKTFVQTKDIVDEWVKQEPEDFKVLGEYSEEEQKKNPRPLT